MSLYITKELNKNDKKYISDELYYFNAKHFPDVLKGRFEEVNLFLKNEEGTTCGGILAEVCWNWLEIHIFMIDEDIRKLGFGTKMLLEIEKVAVEKDCDFIKVDTLSFQALGFYEKNGYEVYGTLDNVGREFNHYYLKKDLKKI